MRLRVSVHSKLCKADEWHNDRGGLESPGRAEVSLEDWEWLKAFDDYPPKCKVT